jgi:hypothetical protein
MGEQPPRRSGSTRARDIEALAYLQQCAPGSAATAASGWRCAKRAVRMLAAGLLGHSGRVRRIDSGHLNNGRYLTWLDRASRSSLQE